MKILISILFLVVACTKYVAQTVFCPPGAEWHYTFSYQAFSPQGFYTNVVNEQIKYDRDSSLNSQNYKVLTHSFFLKTCDPNLGGPSLIKQTGDTIFMRNQYTQHQWQILYNFAATAGSTWTNTLHASSNVYTYNVSVDSVSQITLNSFNLKRLYVKYNSIPAIITERFGANTFLFNFVNGSCDGPQFQSFLCYQDNSFGLKQFSTTPCNYSTALYSGIQEGTKNSTITFFPNPVIDYLEIKMEDYNLSTLNLSLVNGLGQEVYPKKNIHVSDGKISISIRNLPNGIYYVNLFEGSTVVKTGKMAISR